MNPEPESLNGGAREGRKPMAENRKKSEGRKPKAEGVAGRCYANCAKGAKSTARLRPQHGEGLEQEETELTEGHYARMDTDPD